MNLTLVGAALDPLLETMADAEKTAALKTDVYKKAHSALLLCLDNKVLREVNKEDSAARLIGDLANLDVDIDDEDQALMLITSFPSSYDNFVETLLYGRESLTLEDVMSSLNSRKLKKRTYAKDDGDGLYVRGRSDHRALVVVGNDEMTKLVMDSSGSYHMTHRRDFLHDFKVVDGGSVQLGDNRTCTIEGTGKVKIQLHNGSSFILEDVRKNNCVYTLEAKVMTFDVQKHGGSKQVGLKQLGSKQVEFKQLGHKQVRFKELGLGVETGVHGVQVDKRVWFEVEL
nr:retrovirus-related Pol polyprotein from transposon TNT 1-94 [Tanacetum cinerariifolium]